MTSRLTYMVVEDDSANGLAREIDQLLRTGWRLQGGVTITSILRDGDTCGTWYAQALVFEVETPPGAEVKS